MRVELSLILPRDSTSVPWTRRLLAAILKALPVPADEVQDVALALTEACGNVVRHAGDSDDYRVTTRISADGWCEIEVIDRGRGFDPAGAGGLPGEDAEEGRGLALIRALTDCVHLDTRPRVGTLVHFEKQLSVSGAGATRPMSGGGLRPTL
jgi:serine/threonine-protein kinase RsbW